MRKIAVLPEIQDGACSVVDREVSRRNLEAEKTAAECGERRPLPLHDKREAKQGWQDEYVGFADRRRRS